MEYTYLRSLLEEGMEAVEALLDHGFAYSPEGGKELGKLSERFAAAGMDQGVALMSSLAARLEEGRFRVDTTWGEAALVFSQLWDYLANCMDRLNYLEAVDSLKG